MKMDYKKIADYGDIKDAPKSKTNCINSAVNSHGKEYFLKHKTAGYEPSGSMARWTNEAWGVIFYVDGCPNGQWFKTEHEALNLFNSWIVN
jgi:hypothetical protein